MNDIKEICARIASGELARETDEKYARGFWDLASEIADEYTETIGAHERLQEEIYSNLWAVYEATNE